MRFFKSLSIVIVCLSIAMGAFAQGPGKSKGPGQKATDKQHIKPGHSQKRPTPIKKRPTLTAKRPTLTAKRPMLTADRIRRDDRWRRDEDDRFRKNLRLDDNQGRRISAINRSAVDRIHAAQRAGLRGKDLSNRIRNIRQDARRRIERELSDDQRRRCDWDAWERRWDDHWVTYPAGTRRDG